MQRVNLHARPSIIQVGCPTCCYQVCALDHERGVLQTWITIQSPVVVMVLSGTVLSILIACSNMVYMYIAMWVWRYVLFYCMYFYVEKKGQWMTWNKLIY